MTNLYTKILNNWNKLEMRQKSAFEVLCMHLTLMLATVPFVFTIGHFKYAMFYCGAGLGGFAVTSVKLLKVFLSTHGSSNRIAANESRRAALLILGLMLVVLFVVTVILWY